MQGPWLERGPKSVVFRLADAEWWIQQLCRKRKDCVHTDNTAVDQCFSHAVASGVSACNSAPPPTWELGRDN